MCCILFIDKDNTLFLNCYDLGIYMVHIPQRIDRPGDGFCIRGFRFGADFFRFCG